LPTAENTIQYNEIEKGYDIAKKTKKGKIKIKESLNRGLYWTPNANRHPNPNPSLVSMLAQ